VSKLITILFAFLLLPVAASAQIPTRGNVFFGYSYGSADFASGDRTNLNGWNGSLEGKVLPWVGFVADFSGLYGSQTLPILPAVKADTRLTSVILVRASPCRWESSLPLPKPCSAPPTFMKAQPDSPTRILRLPMPSVAASIIG
jgi:hypothetical protein